MEKGIHLKMYLNPNYHTAGDDSGNDQMMTLMIKK